MTRERFCGLQRGDLVAVDGNGDAVVEGVFFSDGLTRINLRRLHGNELIEGIPESECEVVRPIREIPPMTTLGDVLAAERRSHK
jgi:hypothetical protein